MGTDRFIYWDKKTKPTKAKLKHLIEDFFGDAGHLDISHEAFWVVRLPGTTSHPYQRQGKEYKYLSQLDKIPRVIEIYVGDINKLVDVITRHSDYYTSYIADGLASSIKGFYGGKDELG